MPLLDHRPRSASELIDAGFALARRDYVRYCLIAAIGVAPWQVARLVVVRLTGADLSAQAQAVGDLGPLAIVGAVALVFYAFVEAALAVAVSAEYEGTALHLPDALTTGLRRWLPVLLSILLKYVIMVAFAIGGMLVGLVIDIVLSLTLGIDAPDSPVMIALVIFAMLLGVLAALPAIGRYAAVPMTAALEPLGPFAALRRSRELTRGLWKHAVGVSALAWVIVAVPSLGVSLLASQLGPPIVEQLAGIVVTVLLSPIYVASLVALYYDLRIRKEGFDLELMANRLAPPEPDAGTGAPPDIRVAGNA